MYKYELHCHTGTISLCGKVDPRRIVDLYEKAGYSGIVLTDHFSPMTFMNPYIVCPQKKMDWWLSAYRDLKEYCGDDFTILLGMELRHYGTPNDYLIYGATEELFLSQGNLLAVGEKKMYEIFHEAGCLVFQAHPCRGYVHRCNPDYIDGVEIYNGYTSRERNLRAEKWAHDTNKLISSGSDFHDEKDVARGGIITDEKISSNDDLLRVLKTQNFSIIETY